MKIVQYWILSLWIEENLSKEATIGYNIVTDLAVGTIKRLSGVGCESSKSRVIRRSRSAC